MSKGISRRDFVKLGVTSAVTAIASSLSGAALGKGSADLPPGKTALPESNPTAAALSYHADAKKVDKTKFPQRSADQTCANCSFYKEANKNWGECQVIPGGVVAAKGWCASWTKKV